MDSLQHEILVINLQSEEIIFVNTQGSKNFNALSSFKKHSVDDLGTIVQNYQQGDSLAAEQLRQKFYPLISKLSHRHSMYSIFGEDAENIKKEIEKLDINESTMKEIEKKLQKESHCTI